MDKPGDAPPVEHIGTDLPCVSCGYNLRTLPVSGSCPECGQPVVKTARHALVYADREWLGTLREGAAVLGWSAIVVCGFAIPCVVFGLISLADGGHPAWAGAAILGLFAGLGGAIVGAVGVLCFTSGPLGSPRMRARSVPGGAQICLVVLFVLSWSLCLESSVIAALILSTLLLLITLVGVHAKRLAKRAGAAGVAKLATATALAGGVSLGVVGACTALGGILLVLLPSYGGAGWAFRQVGFALFAPVGFLTSVLGTVLMFRVRGMLDRVIEAAEAAPRSAGSYVPTTGRESDKAAAE